MIHHDPQHNDMSALAVNVAKTIGIKASEWEFVGNQWIARVGSLRGSQIRIVSPVMKEIDGALVETCVVGLYDRDPAAFLPRAEFVFKGRDFAFLHEVRGNYNEAARQELKALMAQDELAGVQISSQIKYALTAIVSSTREAGRLVLPKFDMYFRSESEVSAGGVSVPAAGRLFKTLVGGTPFFVPSERSAAPAFGMAQPA